MGFADQGLEFAPGNFVDLDDDVGALAPHVFHEHLRGGFEEELLALVGEVQIKPIGPHHREDALRRAPGRAGEVIDLADAR